MKMLVTNMALAASVALASLVATEAASAQDQPSQETAYVQRHHSEAPPRVNSQSGDIVTGNRVIGRDPDPFIRGEILRHNDSGWPD